MSEVDVFTLDDDRNYLLVEKYAEGNFVYLLLAAQDDAEHLILKKYPKGSNSNVLYPLDSDEEFTRILQILGKSLSDKA